MERGLIQKIKKTSFKIWFYRFLRLCFALGIALGINQLDLDYLDFFTYDLRYQLKPISPKSNNIVTIAVDKKTLKDLGRDATASDHADLLRILKQSEAKAIVFTLSEEDLAGTEHDLQKFADAAIDAPVYFAVNNLFFEGMEGEYKFSPPLDNIKILPGPKTVDKKIFAKDGVTRRAIFSYQGNQTAHPKLASLFNGLSQSDNYQGIFEFLDSKQHLIDFRPTGTYKLISLSDTITGNLQPNIFKDKLVLIGRDNLASSDDYVQTPFSREVTAMSTLEMHANIFDTLILNRAPVRSPKWLDFLITCLISVLTVFIVLRARPGMGLIVLFATLTGLITLSYIILSTSQFVLDLAHPLIALFVCYYFFIPYRLIVENRRSWEYFHKNQLLTQVEELKSNFLRMMSHDLKTPLARIQGMTDIVMREPQKLTSGQQEALQNISKSSEELTEFIGSILSLGRIESKEIKLEIKSKDINSLLNEAIQKCEYQAKKKNIKILTEFEPMFSIRLDEDLMKQVFVNLIENAIKYSPEGSKVLVSTEEVDGKVIVQVADQGIGIDLREQENVFSKFYRSQEVANSPVKGSGLGLYLAKYFVDLHSGMISLESEPQKGSTFTVELPMDVEI